MLAVSAAVITPETEVRVFAERDAELLLLNANCSLQFDLRRLARLL